MKPFYTDQAAWVDKVGRIYAALERVKISEEQNPNKLMLRRQNRITSVHATTAIEGNRLSVGEVAGVVNGVTVFGPPQDILEVQNAYAAYEALETFDPDSVSSFLRAHAVLTTGLVAEAGAFRTVDVEVQREDGEVLHTGADPKIVPKAVGQLLEWAQESPANPLIASSAVHFMIEYIHPFRDGNGRIGRLWQTLLLSRWNDLFAWMPTETLIHHNQLGYYQALQASHNGHIEASPFISYMLDIIEHALDQYRTTVETKPTRAGRGGETPEGTGVGVNDGVNDGASDGASDGLDAAILQALAHEPRLTGAALASALGKSRRTIERRLARLKAAGLLERVGPDKTGSWRVLR
ncbi:MAG: Fic family protein [Propionibacteriaceae bacterium]|nr:Fic family protein [Propionibacteriaceae bacterium]